MRFRVARRTEGERARARAKARGEERREEERKGKREKNFRAVSARDKNVARGKERQSESSPYPDLLGHSCASSAPDSGY